MIRAFVLYEGDVDPERYQQHIDEFVAPIGVTFRHGKVFGSPPGAEQRFHHYAEFEFPDMETFRRVAGTPEFAASGRDGVAMGIPFVVHFAEVD